MKKKSFLITVKPEAGFPKTPADILRNEILDANKEKIAEWLECLDDKSFLLAFTLENRKLLADLLRGKIKKRRGLKQERGFDDFLLFFRYKELRAEGYNWTQAIKKTAEEVETAHTLSKNDSFRQAVEGRLWKPYKIERNIEMIVSKMEKFYNVIETTSQPSTIPNIPTSKFKELDNIFKTLRPDGENKEKVLKNICSWLEKLNKEISTPPKSP